MKQQQLAFNTAEVHIGIATALEGHSTVYLSFYGRTLEIFSSTF
jgi:hypothetical protein